jgi:tripartite-type tricarboxylate transporter receptor subunit TctC
MISFVSAYLSVSDRSAVRGATLAFAAWAVGISPGHTSAADVDKPGFPSKAMRLIVPFSAGGPTDAIARVIAQGLSESTRQQIIA